MMKITGLSHLFKWENLHNWGLTKYFFAPLYMHFDVVLSVFIHPCTKKAEESSIQGCLCACASVACVGNISHSARLSLQQSRASFMLTWCLRAVLISSPDM